MANLAENNRDPADVIHYLDPLFDDISVIREQLVHAVQWIEPIAEEWGREQETRGGPRSVCRTLNDPAHLNAPSREIAAEFLRSHRASISADAWDEVIITGLVHIMGGLRARRPPPVTSDGSPDLFAGFNLDPVLVVRSFEEGKGYVEKNKGLPSLTLPEAEDWLARHTKERALDGRKISEWRRLIKRVKPYMTRDDMTLEEGLKAAAANEEKKAKKGRA